MGARRFMLGGTRVDLEFLVAHRPDVSHSLTPMEAAVFERLLAANEAPVSVETLLIEVWNYGPGVKSRTATVTTHRLRTKLEDDPSNPQYLLTERGRGFVLRGVEPLEQAAPERPSLVGREADLAAARAHPERLLTICGPLGVGKTALALALAPEGTLWIDAVGVTRAEGIFGRLLATAPTSLAPTVDSALHYLSTLRPTAVVLDGLARGLLEQELPQLAAEVPVIVTSYAPRGVAGEAVHRLEPLEEPARIELLRAETVRQGLSVPDAVLQRVAARIDGLPLEISLVGPLVGLFGEHALSSLQTSLEPVLRDCLEPLDEDSREMLTHLAVFHGPFQLQAAAQISARPLPLAAAGLQLFLGRGLLRLGPRGFRLLGPLRTLLLEDVPPAARDRLYGFCRSLAQASLEDAATTAERHSADLIWAAERAPVADADALSQGIYDVACLRGPMVAFTGALDRLAQTGDPAARSRALMVALSLGRAVPEAELAALEERAEGGDLEAAMVGMLTPEAQREDAATVRWQELAHHATSTPEVLARMLPGLLCYNLDDEARGRLAGLVNTCRAQGWTTARRAAQHALLTCLLVQGEPQAVLATELEPGDDDIDSRVHLVRAAAALQLGQAEAAEQEAREARRAASRTLLDAVLLEAMADLLGGNSAAATLRRVNPAFATGLPGELYRCLSHWPDTAALRHPTLVAILEHGRVPEGFLPGRLTIGFAGLVSHTRG